MRNRLNVLVLAQYFPPDMGGSSTRASNVVKGLLSKGCEVKVVAAFPHYPHGNVPAKYRGKPIVSEMFNGARVLRVWVFSSLFALPFVGGVDVVWAANPNLFGFYSAVVYGFVKRVPVVRNVDDLWPEVFYELGIVRSRLMRKMLNFLAWLSYVVPAAITPISHGYKRRIVEKYGIRAEKVHVVEVGVDRVEPFTLNLNDVKKGRFVVMYSGVLGLGYDFDVVLEAARILRGNGDVVFVVRGVGELGLDNVVLDTSFLPKEKLSALLGSADVFVLPMASMSFVEERLCCCWVCLG
jgi:colanic acid biosynthesis glycosyl transferase WcaI